MRPLKIIASSALMAFAPLSVLAQPAEPAVASNVPDGLRATALSALARHHGAPLSPRERLLTGQSSEQGQGQEQSTSPDDGQPPAVNPGRPTVTDPASLTAPGWLETELGGTSNLDRDRTFNTPLLLKLTDRSRRLQYRLAFDGYVHAGEQHADAFGETYLAAQYLLTKQSSSGYDTATRATLKIPTAPAFIGDRKLDYGLEILASRDYSSAVHADYNLGLTVEGRQDAGGTDAQLLYSASFSFPFRGHRWQYTNELVYTSPTSQERGQLTTLHGFTYAAHRYDIYDIALQWGLYGDGPVFQLLFGRTFFLSKLF